MEDFLKSKEAMEAWKQFIGHANMDIFDVIKHAIKVAASDRPTEFRTMRDKITEMLYSPELSNCGGGDKFKKKQSMNVTCEVQDETTEEVLRIKGILDKKSDDDMPEAGLVYNLLRKLQEMELSYEILEATGIGTSVNALKKHQLREVSGTARMVINEWKHMVEERENAEECGESKNSSLELMTEKQDIETSKPQQSLKANSVEDYASKGPLTPEQNVAADQGSTGDEWLNKKSSAVKPISVQDKPRSLDMERKINPGKRIVIKVPRVAPPELVRNNQKEPTKTVPRVAPPELVRNNQKGPTKTSIEEKVKETNNQKGPRVAPDQQCKSRMISKEETNNKKGPTYTSIQEKFDATKKMFQQRYTEEENLKKRRRVQVLELHEVISKGRIPPKDQQNKRFRR